MSVNNIVNKEYSLFSMTNAYAFLFGILGSMVIVTIFYLVSEKPQEIGVVNVTAIINEFVQNKSKQNKPEDVLAKEVKQFCMTLESTLKAFAKENNIILMPREAIIAGSHDYTALIKKKIQTVMQQNQAENND